MGKRWLEGERMKDNASRKFSDYRKTPQIQCRVVAAKEYSLKLNRERFSEQIYGVNSP